MPEFLTSDKIRLFYKIEGTGAPLLLLNGMFGDLAFWDPVLENLRDHRTCVLLDHRGIGQSDRWEGVYTYELWARDAVELLDHLGLGSAPVLGLCQGGMVGAVMALRHSGRITGMVAHGTRLLESAKTRVFDKFRRRLLDLGGVDLMMGTQMGLVFGEAALAEIEPYLGRMEANSKDRLTTATAGPMLDALVEFSMSPLDIASMTIPALFLAGEEDLYVPPWLSERTASLWPGAEFQVMMGIGHIVPREAPRDLAARTLAFLGKHGI
jgi:pimeloyl-ACP methyl ester carboxylesterase